MMDRLDLYLPPESNKPKPVVIFVTGGAWIIGYKAWGTLLGQQLVERDIIVVCIDYRNFPQGCISNMVSDVTTGIGYVIQNVGSYGGDADRLVCNTNHTFCCWAIADSAYSTHNL
jgi:prenylcysteine alpha-carboxyl methylesterase